jgi:23S rRNA (guanosine2251-2'-O)-methyltransferase
VRVIYGKNPVIEALKTMRPGDIDSLMVEAGAESRYREAMDMARKIGASVKVTDRAMLRKASGTDKNQGIVAIAGTGFKYSEIEVMLDRWKASGEEALFIILDSIEDPQNFGSIARASAAAGAHGVIIPSNRACGVTGAVAKASAGAVEHVMIARETNLVRVIEALKRKGVWVAGLSADAKDTIYSLDLRRDLAIVVGGEGAGIRRLVREACDFLMSIPMSGLLNSLNAGQAAAVALFEARRQRLKE